MCLFLPRKGIKMLESSRSLSYYVLRFYFAVSRMGLGGGNKIDKEVLTYEY